VRHLFSTCVYFASNYITYIAAEVGVATIKEVFFCEINQRCKGRQNPNNMI